MLIVIRHEGPLDLPAIRGVNLLAFGGVGEANLVDALRDAGDARLSVVAEVEDQIVGHVMFSRLKIHQPTGDVFEALALAPMAVVPALQRQGVGTTLITSALQDCAAAGHRAVIVLGHAKYYPRFGFSTQLTAKLESPYAGPHFMALELVPGALADVTGRVEYPPAFSEV